ncbi:MAG: hypothetical protein K9H16_09555 [Bacteroidales bacterium]|nr:hypothetical protein [Bacteroidales bacterium]
MKSKIELFLMLSLSIIFFLASCSKDEDKIETDTITEEDAVEVVENALQEESGGIDDQISTSMEMASNYADPEANSWCGWSFDSLITETNPSGTLILYTYSFAWNWKLVCNDQQMPERFEFAYDMDGWYDAPRIKSTDTGNHNFTLAGFSISDDVYVYNGTYTRNGSNQMKTGFQNAFTSTLSIEAVNVSISKTTGKITGGTANVVFQGKTSGGKVFDYEGTITYTTNETAILKFENEFTIQL